VGVLGGAAVVDGRRVGAGRRGWIRPLDPSASCVAIVEGLPRAPVHSHPHILKAVGAGVEVDRLLPATDEGGGAVVLAGAYVDVGAVVGDRGLAPPCLGGDWPSDYERAEDG